jgi:type I restriction enzyme M protein
MTNNKKEQERSALHATIWRIANDLRGSVDGWDFKQYVLGMLFYRFISENLSSYINEKQREAGEKNFDYALLKDKEAERGRDLILEEKGFGGFKIEVQHLREDCDTGLRRSKLLPGF